MKMKVIVDISFSAMNEFSLFERLRDAIFEWQRTEPKVRAVEVNAPPDTKESRPTVRRKPPVQQLKAKMPPRRCRDCITVCKVQKRWKNKVCSQYNGGTSAVQHTLYEKLLLNFMEVLC